MAKKRVTVRDLAARVGVNVSTVSRALNPETRKMITPEVVQKVVKAAEDLGYVPNRVAAALASNRSHTIGVLIPDLMNPVFPPILRGLQDACDKANYTLISSNSDNRAEYERSAIREMRERAVDGFVMATARREDPLIEDCIDQKLPFVLINRTVDRDGVNAIVNDDAAGIRMAVEHLISLNHVHIAHIAGPQHTSTGFTRREEFLSRMHLKGLSTDHIAETKTFSIEAGRLAMNELLARGEKVTAVVASNDLLALGCLDAMKEQGLRCPEDISIVGFNNIPFLDRMTPALTTLAIPHYEIGVHAAENLLLQIRNPDKEPLVIKLQPKLIVRNSTAEPPS